MDYDPDIRDRLFIRNIDQLQPYSNALSQDIENAQTVWNNLGSGPQYFSLSPERYEVHNFLKAMTEEDVGPGFWAVQLACNSYDPPPGGNGGDCTRLFEPVNQEWSEVWFNTDSQSPECVPCEEYPAHQRWTFMHEFGHVLGLGHHGNDIAISVMAGEGGVRNYNTAPGPSQIEAGDHNDCKGGIGSTIFHGVRCIYDWYCNDAGSDSDCDRVSYVTDNCSDSPNESQTDTNGERLDLGTVATYDDMTNPHGMGLAGDVCDPDDDGDNVQSHLELQDACLGAITDPLDDDTDNDRVLDGVECLLGFNPANASSKPPTTPDADNDLLADGYETLIFGTNPNNNDSDGDHVLDGVEVLRYMTHPLLGDSDGGGGCPDNKEIASINADYTVNAVDLSQIGQRFGSYPAGDRARRNFDPNRDGVVNSLDQTWAGQQFGPCV